MTPGPWQILVVALLILLLFGAGRLADIGKGLGQGIKNFKKGITETDDDDDGDDKEPKQLQGKDPTASESSKEKDESRS